MWNKIVIQLDLLPIYMSVLFEPRDTVGVAIRSAFLAEVDSGKRHSIVQYISALFRTTLMPNDSSKLEESLSGGECALKVRRASRSSCRLPARSSVAAGSCKTEDPKPKLGDFFA